MVDRIEWLPIDPAVPLAACAQFNDRG